MKTVLKYKWFKISYVEYFFFLLKILLRTCSVFIFVQTFQLAPPQFFLNFRFSSRESQSQQKLAKKITHFTIQFRSTIVRTSIHDTLSQHSQKPFWLYKFSSRHVCFVSEKIFALHPFLTPNNCILEALWKQMFVYFYISTYENVSFRDLVRFHLMGNELGGKWITSLRQLTFYASQNVLQYFILIEIFKNSAILQHLDTCIYSIKTLKFSRQVGLQG